MKRSLSFVAALALAVGLVAGTAGAALAQAPLPPDQLLLRVVHAIPNGPPVDVVLEDTRAFADLPYTGVTRYSQIAPASYSVRVVPTTPIGPGGLQATPGVSPALIDTSVELVGSTIYTAVLVGTTASPGLVTLTDDLSAPPAGMARLRFMHASPDAPPVDVAVANGPALASNVSFRDASGYTTVSPGTYTLEVRQAGTGTTLLTVPNVTLTPDAVFTIYAVGLVSGSPSLAALTTVDSVAGVPVPTG